MSSPGPPKQNIDTIIIVDVQEGFLTSPAPTIPFIGAVNVIANEEKIEI